MEAYNFKELCCILQNMKLHTKRYYMMTIILLLTYNHTYLIYEQGELPTHNIM